MDDRSPSQKRFGRSEVYILEDGVWETRRDNVVNTRGDAALARTLEAVTTPALHAPVNCFLVKNDFGRTLIDAGTGLDWGEAFGRARLLLNGMGIAPDDISNIVLTHIHVDHACGLFDGERRYFPNADIWVGSEELAFFTDPSARAAAPERRRDGFDIAGRLLGIYGARVIPANPGPLFGPFEMVSLPGHTPGHCGVLLRAGEEALLSLGDAVHFQDLQFADPDVGVPFDFSSTQAAATRHRVFETVHGRGWHVCGGHMDGFATLGRQGDHYVRVPS
ncbi:MAG: MBL fold metallo-hydrolase [Rhizobiaceae bacterium]